MKKSWAVSLVGAATGFLNGFFGAGGGMVAVPMLQKSGLSTQEAHATSIAIILPLTVVSAILYFCSGSLAPGEALIYLPGGVAGALVGAYLLKKLDPLWIRRIFGVLILFSALRMLWK